MKWTTDKPQIEGWYWIKHPKYGTLIEYMDESQLALVNYTKEKIKHHPYAGCLYAGPIELPIDGENKS